MTREEAERLLEENTGLVYRIAFSFLRACRRVGLEMDDVCQEAMMSAYRAILDYDPTRGVKVQTLMGAYAKTRIINLIRAAAGKARGHGRTVQISALEWFAPVDQSEPVPEHVAREWEAGELTRPLLRWLDEMRPQLAQVVRMVAVEGKTGREVGEALGCSHVTAAKMYRRGIEWMRAISRVARRTRRRGR